MSSFSLVDTIMGVTARHPDREAIGASGVSLTFAELVRVASQCARFLARHGVETGDRVAIAITRPEQTLIAMLACWLLGATGMVLDFRTRPAERSSVARDFDLKAIVEARSPPDETPFLSVPVGESLPETVAGEDDAPFIRPEDVCPAFIIRTSGTTGTPQGVVFGHGAFMRTHWMMGATFLGFDRGLFIQAFPLNYAAGFMRSVSQLLDGGTTHFLPMASASELAEKLFSSKARITAVVPSQLRGLLELSAGRTTPMFPDLHSLTATGTVVPPELSVRAYLELSRSYVVTYGGSFCGGISWLHGEDVLKKPHSVGRPYAFNHLQIIDAEGRLVGPGESGLLRVRGATAADEILGMGRADSDRIVDGWVIPGDMGYLDEDGFLVLTGRASDMIIRKGINVFPRDVEDVLERCSGVVEAAVIGFPSIESGEEIAAFVVVRGSVSLEDLAGYARTRLVADKRPRVIRIVDQLPRNESGKVLKRVLADELTEFEKTSNN